MFDTTLISRRAKYIYRGESLNFSHTDENKRGGTIFIFKNKKGTWKRITQTNCQKELWEEISEAPKLQELIEVSVNKPHLLNPPQNP